jgi:hypothetical protein
MISIRRVFAFIVIFSVIEFRGNLLAWGPKR